MNYSSRKIAKLCLGLFCSYEHIYSCFLGQLTAPPLIEPEIISNSSICALSLSALKKTKVFIVHENHCRECNNVTHSLANLLNETGYVECILDFCCTNEITERGMIWYEDKIKLCDKVLVVCTKDGKAMYDKNYQTNGW